MDDEDARSDKRVITKCEVPPVRQKLRPLTGNLGEDLLAWNRGEGPPPNLSPRFIRFGIRYGLIRI